MTKSHLPHKQPLGQSQWQQARLARDPRFDGVFYIGVITTGIFCRPICPAQLPREDNVRYLSSAALAVEQGFRPCRRCRPEYSPSAQQQWPDERLDRTIKAINEGYLDQHDLEQLAQTVDLSERQLRRLFTDTLGVSPSQIADTRRLLLAKQLLCESDLPVTHVALAAGFNSVRRFNSRMKDFYRQTPSEMRHTRSKTQSAKTTSRYDHCSIDLPHRPDYPWQQLLAFYQQRALDGMEQASHRHFSRVLSLFENPVFIHIEKKPRKHLLQLRISGAKAEQLTTVIAHVRKVLDLNTHHSVVTDWLRRDKTLRSLIPKDDRLALPGAWDAFEYLIRAVIGQQVSVKAARTLTQRVLQRCGQQVKFNGDDYWCFPRAEHLCAADLSGLGLTTRRIETIQIISRAVVRQELDLSAAADLEQLSQRLMDVKGIGRWTVDYLLMRAFFQPDIWLDTDLGVINALSVLEPELCDPNANKKSNKKSDRKPNKKPNKKRLHRRADSWSPWRSYAVLALWRSLSNNSIHSPGGNTK